MAENLPTILQRYLDFSISHVNDNVLPLFNEKAVIHAVMKYFDDWWNENSKIDRFFLDLWPVWVGLYKAKMMKANDYLDIPIILAHQWEAEHEGKLLHKGSPYYLKGILMLQTGNVESGFLYFHQAVTEDRRHASNWDRKTPAWLFVSLNVSNPAHTTWGTVKEVTEWFEQRYLARYRAGRRKFLTYDRLQLNVLALLLKNEKDQLKHDETTFSFTYSIFRIKQLLLLPDRVRNSKFASQIELDILFSLARISERWLKHRQSKIKGNLGEQLINFFKNNKLEKIAEQEHKTLASLDFNRKLSIILERGQEKSNVCLSGVFDLLLLGVLRNEAGHSPTASEVVQERFPELVERAFFGLFIIAETLYA